MKKITLVSLLTLISLNVFAAKKGCSENAKHAAKSIEVINSNTTKSNIIVARHELLGRIMILTGYLLKYETELNVGPKSTKAYYQTYVLEADCTIQEMNKVEPFDYN